jgi:type VI secretion system protein ImpB
MANDSVQDKLSRTRKPRVHITYNVEVGDAIELKELPFVMGVMGDFTGKPDKDVPRLMDRKFVEITPDNFDDVLKKIRPHVDFAVDNKLISDPKAGQIKVDLTFEKLTDFEPDQVAQKIPPLKELLDLRTRLADLRGSLQGNARLDEMLHEVVTNTEKRQQLSNELGLKPREGDKNG